MRAIAVGGKGARRVLIGPQPARLDHGPRCIDAPLRRFIPLHAPPRARLRHARFVSALTACRHDDRFASPATYSMCRRGA
jgi:hypothetical protein